MLYVERIGARFPLDLKQTGTNVSGEDRNDRDAPRSGEGSILWVAGAESLEGDLFRQKGGNAGDRLLERACKRFRVLAVERQRMKIFQGFGGGRDRIVGGFL